MEHPAADPTPADTNSTQSTKSTGMALPGVHSARVSMPAGVELFSPEVSETELQDLRARLRATRWPEPATDAA